MNRTRETVVIFVKDEEKPIVQDMYVRVDMYNAYVMEYANQTVRTVPLFNDRHQMTMGNNRKKNRTQSYHNIIKCANHLKLEVTRIIPIPLSIYIRFRFRPPITTNNQKDSSLYSSRMVQWSNQFRRALVPSQTIDLA